MGQNTWTPPSYAIPIDDGQNSSEWKPPSYAVPVKTEETKKSDNSNNEGFFGRAIDKASELYHNKYIHRLLAGPEGEPEYEAERTIRGIKGPELGPGLTQIPGVQKGFDWLANEIDNPKGEGSTARGFAAGALQGLGGLLATSVDPRVAAPVTGVREYFKLPDVSVEDLGNVRPEQKLLNAGKTYVSPKSTAYQGELPIRQSTEVPYRMNPDAQIPETTTPTIQPNGKELSVKEGEIIPPEQTEPTQLPIQRPQARFKYMWENAEGQPNPMYGVEGAPSESNPSGGSDISFGELAKRGIDLAEGPNLPRPVRPPQPASGIRKLGKDQPAELKSSSVKPTLDMADEWKPPDYAKLVSEQPGEIGPHNDMSPERLIQSVINGDKSAAVLDNLKPENAQQLVDYAKSRGLHVIDSPIVKGEPIIARDQATGESLVKAFAEGNHATAGKLLGYSDKDVAAFVENRNGIPETIQRMRVTNAAGEEGAAIGPEGTAKLFNLLTHNVYENPPEKIIPKELITNAMDAVKSKGDAGNIDVHVDIPNARHYNDPLHEARSSDYKSNINFEISDNGNGMDTGELQTVFTNLGESGKENDPTASGGFGIAKGIIFKGSSKITVESIKDTPNGRMKYTMTGDPTNYDKFMPITEEKAGKFAQTGTKVKVSIPVKWAARDHITNIQSYIENTVKHSNLKGKINFNSPNYEDPTSEYAKDPKTGLTDYTKQNVTYPNKATIKKLKFKSSELGDHIADADASNASLSIYKEQGSTLVKSKFIPVHLLNNGLYQGSYNHGVTHDEALSGLPSGIVVDVKSKIKEGDPGYPWSLSRESILGDAKDKLDKTIQDKIVEEITRKREEALQKLYNNLPEISVPGTIRKPIFFDSGGRLTPSELRSFINSPVITQAVKVYDELIDQVLNALKKLNLNERLEGVGIVLDPTSHGLHIPNNKTGKSVIVINPFLTIGKNTPEEAAFDTAITVLHEGAHVGDHTPVTEVKLSPEDIADPRVGKFLEAYINQIQTQGGLNSDHGFSFEKRLGEVFSTVGVKNVNKAADELTRIFTEGGVSGGYNPETERLLQIYQTSRGRKETTEDLLTGTSVSQKDTGPRTKGNQTGSDKADGNGPSSSVIAKLRDAIDKGIEQAKKQAQSYTEEKADRLKAVRDVHTPGMAGYYQKLSKLKGDYSKIGGIPPLGGMLTAKEIDALRDVIDQSPVNDEFAKLHATSGLVKLLNGDIPQPSELDALNSFLGATVKNDKTSGTFSNAPHGEPIEFKNKPNEVRGQFKGGKGEPETSEDIFRDYREHVAQYNLMKTPSVTRQVYELTRGLMSVDVPYMTSAAFRQGIGLVGTGNWFRAFKAQAQSFGDERVYDKIMDGVSNNIIHRKRAVYNEERGRVELVSIADQIGLKSSDLKSLSRREEQIRSTLSEKIPGLGAYIRASNRSYTAMLNVLRTHTAEDWLNAAGLIDKNNSIPPDKMKEARQLAYTINELTGAASMKIGEPLNRFTGSTRELDLDKAADAVSIGFFSPRNRMRDARMMNPLNYIKNDKLNRLKYLAGMARRAGVWAGFTGLAALLGATVEMNPTSSDFGKAKIGNTRLDAGTGLLQWIVFMSRQALGTSKSTATGKVTELGSNAIAKTRLDVLNEFVQNALHPTLGFGIDALIANKNRPFYPISDALSRVIPMYTSDLADLAKSDPDARQIILGLVAASTSMGAQTYGPKDYGEPQFDFPAMGKKVGLNIPPEPKFEGGKLVGDPIRQYPIRNRIGVRLR